MCAQFYRNRTFSFKVMIKKTISDEKFRISLRQSWKKRLGQYCPIWFKKSPPFPQGNVDPSHVARGRVRSANID